MHTKQSPLRAVCRALAAVTFAGAATLGLQAQQTASSAQSLFFVPPPSTATLLATNDAANNTTPAIGYSSSAGAEETASAENYMSNSVAANPGPQPPPRYGRRPVYADSSHNADGSNKYGFEAGVGLTLPTGNTHSYFDTSYSFQVGAGRNFNKKLGVMFQFDWDAFGLSSQALTNQEALYNYGCVVDANVDTCVSGLGGNNHLWSFSLNPVYTIAEGDKVGAYAVVGVGFYHKVTNFTLPQTACADYYCDYEYEYAANIDHYTSNAPGFNGGLGLTYKPSRFGGERFFVEARYVFVDNSQRQGYTLANVATTTYSGNDAFPANSNRTTYIPIKFGVRF